MARRILNAYEAAAYVPERPYIPQGKAKEERHNELSCLATTAFFMAAITFFTTNVSDL